MKGLIKVTPESLLNMVNSASEYMQSFNKEDYAEKQTIWSWRKFKKVEWTYYKGMPFFYQYRNSLLPHMKKLSDIAKNAINTGDEIWLSELSYCHLLMLSKGDSNANPIYIMDY